MPRSMQARTMPRTASTPRRCPATRGRRRCLAQRPLPSMMTATWRGTSRLSGMAVVVDVNTVCSRLRPPQAGSRARLYNHQIRCLRRENLVDFGDRAVGELLHVGLRMTLVVLGDGMILQQLLQVLVCVAPDVADGNARVLGLVPHDLDEIAPSLFGERRHWH